VAGENSKSGALRGQPTKRIRPHWWAVLALSVSLLALVAATSSRPKTSSGTAATPSPTAHRQSAPTTSTPRTTTTTTQPARAAITVTPPTTTPQPDSGSTVGAHVVVQQSTLAPTTTTTTTAAATAGSSVAAAGQTVAPLEFPGDLQQPDDATNSFPFPGSGAMKVSVSSKSTVPLLLTVSCPEGIATQAGSSLVSVIIPDADGPCDVVLKETVVQYVAVPYTITVGPE
jgi:cytoskeletal protein RodZ